MARTTKRPPRGARTRERILFTTLAIAWLGAMLLALIGLASWVDGTSRAAGVPPSDAIVAELIVPPGAIEVARRARARPCIAPPPRSGPAARPLVEVGGALCVARR